MKVMIVPHPEPDRKLHLGIQQIIRAWVKWMPRSGVEFVDREDQADIVHHAIGDERAERVDVLSFHGLHPTAEGGEGGAAFAINKRVIGALRKAKKVVAVSDWIADIIRRDMRFNPIVLPCGIDPADWVRLKKGSYSTTTYALWAKNRVGGVCDPKPLNELAKRCPEMAFVTTFGDEAPNVTVTGLLPFAQVQPVINDAAVYLALTKETGAFKPWRLWPAAYPSWGPTGGARRRS